MSPRKEIENKKCENGVILDAFHQLKLKKNIENVHICMFFLVHSHEYKKSYMNCSSNLVHSQI
jgi:hypothetical protein